MNKAVEGVGVWGEGWTLPSTSWFHTRLLEQSRNRVKVHTMRLVSNDSIVGSRYFKLYRYGLVSLIISYFTRNVFNLSALKSSLKHRRFDSSGYMETRLKELILLLDSKRVPRVLSRIFVFEEGGGESILKTFLEPRSSEKNL